MIKDHQSVEQCSSEQCSAEGHSDCTCSEPAAKLSSSKLLRNIRGIIFDFDGTLFDNALLPFYLISAYPLDIFRIWKERLVRKSFIGCDHSTPPEYYRAFFAALGKACWRSPEKIRSWYFNRYMPRMIRVLKRHYKPRPGAIELLQCFDRKADGTNIPAALPRIAIYSDYPLLKERLEALGIYPGLDTRLYGPESFGAQKPAARPFQRIARDMGVAPEEVLVIGDRKETDGMGAFKAGMRFFCLETGRKHYFPLDPGRSQIKERPLGPSLVMYAGTWNDLNTLLLEKYLK